MFNQGPMYSSFPGLMSSLPKAGFSWGGLLTNAQKILGVVNQAIPVFYQVKPIWNNAKTLFRVMGEMGKINTNDNNSRSNVVNNNTNSTTATNNQTSSSNNQNNGPNFFI